MDLQKFGEALREERKKRGLTSDQLAELCERTPVYIRQLEAGIKTPSLKTLIALCNALPCSPEQLLTNELRYHEWDNATDLMHQFHALTPKQQEQLKILMDTFFHSGS